MSKQSSINRVKIPLKGGGEHDVLTPWRKLLCISRKRIKYCKRSYNKRLRRVTA
jgi:hypothetical protein